MASAAQILANQANAQLSTGPKSPEGKARSAANSTKDGLTSANPVVDSHQSEEFHSYRQALENDTHPEGPIEHEYFHRLLTAGWNLRRARTLESELLDKTNPSTDDQDAARLHRIARYRRELERTYDRALKQLQTLQTQRAILLQRPAEIIDAVARLTPLASLTAIAPDKAPFLFAEHHFGAHTATFDDSRNE
ncbi:MAG: hypothetical protein HY821_02070, partial [Acidobacteria bacterium]|nr:hypothetical protein [Acidobacteriota bacterium]